MQMRWIKKQEKGNENRNREEGFGNDSAKEVEAESVEVGAGKHEGVCVWGSLSEFEKSLWWDLELKGEKVRVWVAPELFVSKFCFCLSLLS